MTGHLRVSSPWSQLGIFSLVFLPQVLLLVFSASADTSNIKIDYNNRNAINLLKWLQAGSSLIFFLLPAFLYAVFTFRDKYFYFLGFRKAERTSMYGLGILCILVAFPFVFWLGELNQKIPLPEWMTGAETETMKLLEAMLKVNHPMDIVINVFIIAVLPAICEELCFRGALQRILIHCTKSPWAGIIITAILFSALHLQFQGFLPRMFLGIVLGALYWYSGSLWTSILAHFVNNAVQVIAVSYAPQYVSENPTMPVFAGLASGIIVFIILWVYARLSTVTFSKVYESERFTSNNQFLA